MKSSDGQSKMCNIANARDNSTLKMAVQTLLGGGLVAIPTETVYGLGADIGNASAIARVFAVKGRPANHPLIVHIADFDDLQRVARDIPHDALRLAQACWPGPLSLLLMRSETIPLSVTGGRQTVAVRVPANNFTRQLIKNLGSPIAAPSANRFGKVSPTTAQHVCDDLQNDVDLIVDDGASLIGVESTIVDFSTSHPQLLRPGGIPVEDIENILGYAVHNNDGVSRASGMLTAHYQPKCTVVLTTNSGDASDLYKELSRSGTNVRILDRCDNLPIYAAALYSDLRQADRDGVHTLIAVMPATVGLGSAICDRLTKAAAL